MEHSAVLLIDCPDRPGLVARVSSLLYEHGANILHADQHQDHELGLFFMRVEWALAVPATAAGQRAPADPAQDSAAGENGLAGFQNAFASLAEQLQMHWTLVSTSRR